jgi:hypothetical protein
MRVWWLVRWQLRQQERASTEGEEERRERQAEWSRRRKCGIKWCPY